MLTPIELLYYLGYRVHRKTKGAFQKKLHGYTISVGNLTLGGTGKTPMVMAIASEAVKRGLSTCILTRGYKGKAKSLIVSCGKGPEADWKATGDEPYLMAKRLKSVWIVKDNNRYRGGLLAGNKDLFILDDGFQHWALYRNLDIVLIDGTNPFGNGRLLPFGPLREPLDALKRASVVVITKVRKPDATLVDKILSINPDLEIFTAIIEPLEYRDLRGNTYTLQSLKGSKAFVFCGIANPVSFIQSLEKIGVEITDTKRFRDHHEYSPEELRKLTKRAKRSGADIIITTEKDMVKLEDMPDSVIPENLYSLVIKMTINDPDRYFKRIFQIQNSKTP